MLVYLADLRHKTITLTPDAMPLGIGYLAAYATKALGAEVQCRLFCDPEYLLDQLRHTRPDVMGVTNYCWNYALHSRILRYARDLYPDLLTVMGGPNISLDRQGEEARLRQTSGLDLYVINEGEKAFARLLASYLEAGMDKKRLFQQPQASSIFVDPDSGHLVRGTPTARMQSLDEMPSPYLTGLMDQFFDGVFCPMIQTNRGCPFTCTFCVEGVSYMTKVNKFSLDRVREELQYISHKVAVGAALMISDSNFGMLPGDLETARSIREIQDRTGWPKFFYATTGKNNKETILAAIDVLGGTMSMTNSVQSMDAQVLTNIKRSNIKLETYATLQQEVKARNLQSYAEVIIGLPGESKESFFRGVCQLLDSGVQRVCCYQLMLLEGTEMCNEATRGKYGPKTKFRMLSRALGIYAEEPVFELEEVVVETSTLKPEDYVECRKLQLVMEIYHREGLFRELLAYLTLRQVPISAFILDLLTHLHEAPQEVKTLFADYLTEAQEELFDSPEEARGALTSNYHKLVSDELGGNLVQKYSALAWFRTLGPTLQYGIQRAQALVLQRHSQGEDGTGFIDRELDAIRKYLEALLINIIAIADQLGDRVVPLEYDIEGWIQSGYRQPLADFQHWSSISTSRAEYGARDYLFYVQEAHAAYLVDKLKVHGTSAQAVGKLLSRVLLADLRRRVKPLPTVARVKP